MIIDSNDNYEQTKMMNLGSCWDVLFNFLFSFYLNLLCIISVCSSLSLFLSIYMDYHWHTTNNLISTNLAILQKKSLPFPILRLSVWYGHYWMAVSALRTSAISMTELFRFIEDSNAYANSFKKLTNFERFKMHSNYAQLPTGNYLLLTSLNG